MQGWLTLDDIPDRVDVCINLPDAESWRAQFLGALLELSKSENWEAFGALSPDEMSDEWRSVLFDFINGSCPVYPVGTIWGWGGNNAPSGWLLCDGDALDRVIFSELFGILGTRYGVGDGSTTFNIPDARGRTFVCRDPGAANFSVCGDLGGELVHELSLSESPVHTHVQNAHTHVQNQHTHVQDAHTHVQNAHTHALYFDAGAGSGSTRRQMIDAPGPPTTTVVSGSATPTNQNTTPTNQNTTPTNQNATPTNVNTTPTNQNTTPTNQNTTPTNQDSGSGDSHNNVQPYLTINYIIKY